jgi:hypothetical protein
MIVKQFLLNSNQRGAMSGSFGGFGLEVPPPEGE